MRRPEERRQEAPELRGKHRPRRRPLEIRVNRQPVIPANLQRAIRLRRLRATQRRDRVRPIRTRRTALRSLLRIRTTRIIRIQTRTIRMRHQIIQTPARTPAEFRLRRIRLRLRALLIQVRQIRVQTRGHRTPDLRLQAEAVRLLVPHAVKNFLYCTLADPILGSAFLLVRKQGIRCKKFGK